MTIDANIVIAYLAGERVVIETLSQWREAGQPLFLSTVAEAEVLSFSDWSVEESSASKTYGSDEASSDGGGPTGGQRFPAFTDASAPFFAQKRR